MELSILLMEQIAKLFIMIFMGYAIVKMGFLKDEDSKVLSTLGIISDRAMCDSECISGGLYPGKGERPYAGMHRVTASFIYPAPDRQPDRKSPASE